MKSQSFDLLPSNSGCKETQLPLSSSQQRLWFFDQLRRNSPLYNIPIAVRLKGDLHPMALLQSIAAVVQRHEVLRTRFISFEGKPWQQPFNLAPMRWGTEDLTKLPDQEREHELRRQLESEVIRPFNLSDDVLLRARLFRIREDEHVLFVNMHHIASDAQSFTIFFCELSHFYESFTKGRSCGLPELRIQYGDYAAWEQDKLASVDPEPDLKYWKKELADAPNVLELPTDRPRTAASAFRGDQRQRQIPGDLIDSLKELSRREGITLFILLLSAFKSLLFRLTQHEDILVGTPITTRNNADIEDLIGFFSNTLVIRSRPSGTLSFRELLRQVRATMLEAYAHQELPFEKVIEEIRPSRVVNHAPLIQVMFAVQTSFGGEIILPGIQATLQILNTHTAKFDLTFTIHSGKNGWLAEMEFDSDLFDGNTIERWLKHYEVLLRGVAQNPDILLSELPLLDATDREQLLVDWNQTTTDYPANQCVHELFEEQAARNPEAIALILGQERLTYRELNARANQLAHYLKNNGVGPGTCVAVCMERSLELMIALLAILKAGGAYAALDLASPKQRLLGMIEDLKPPILLIQHRLRELLNGAECQPTSKAIVLCLDTDWNIVTKESINNLDFTGNPEALAYVSFTSGSTGRPKGVCIPHRGVVRLVKETNYASFSSDEVFLQLSPISFDASTFEIWGSLLNGARLVLFPPHTPSLEELGKTIEQHGVTTLWLTAGLFQLMVDDQITRLKGVRQLLAGGDVLSTPHVLQVLQKIPGCQLINGYGPTENTTFTCCYRVPNNWAGGKTVPIGRPISNTRVYVLDKNKNLVPIGVPGELYIDGDGLAREYLNCPELTAERFAMISFESGSVRARLYKTGDIVRWRADGNLEFIGRRDQQIKIRGFRIELGEIEAALMRHPAIRETVVMPRAEGSDSQELVAYITLKERQTVDTRALSDFLKERLPVYMLPAQFVELEKLPLTSNGKVDRGSLPMPNKKTTVAESYTPPRSAVETKLAEIWTELFRKSPIGIHDNFFQLGGHSLLATQLASRIGKAFDIELTVGRIFDAPILAKLAEIVDAQRPMPGSQLLKIPTRQSRRLRAQELLERLDGLTEGEIDALLQDPQYKSSRTLSL